MTLAFKRKHHRLLHFLHLNVILLLSLLIVSPVYGYEDLNLNMTTWDLSAQNPWRYLCVIIVRDSVDSSGNIWFVGYSSGVSLWSYIGRLNPSTNEVTTWTSPIQRSTIMSVTVDNADKVWFVDPYNSYVGQLDPASNLFTIWEIPGIQLVFGDVSVIVSSDSKGNVYIPVPLANKIARINLITNELTEWPIPTDNSMPYCVDVDANGNVWFTEYAGNKIGRLNPATNEITEWPIPTHNSGVSVLDASGGFIYFVEAGAGKIGRLNPATNEITQWFISAYIGESPSQGLCVDSSANIWFTAYGYLLKLGADNILTYWGIGGYHTDGATVDAKVNVGDVYIGTYAFEFFGFGSGAIRRFRPVTP
jgi:virginiamycin B lyase